MSPQDLDQLDSDIAYLGAGPDSVHSAEETILRVARSLFESNDFAVAAPAERADVGVDLVAKHADGSSVGVIAKCTVHRLGVPELSQATTVAQARRQSSYVLVTNSQLRMDAVEFARQAARFSVSILTLEQIRGWAAGVRARVARPTGAVAELVVELSRKLIRLIAGNPLALHQVEWRDLERTLAEAFAGLGFQVTLTPPSRDGGKDIVLECIELGSRRSYVVEIKHWICGKTVGGRHINKFVNVILNERHASGLFLSTSGFAGNAFEALSESEVRSLRIGGKEKMVAVCDTYVRAETGLWAPEKKLSEILFEATEDPYPVR